MDELIGGYLFNHEPVALALWTLGHTVLAHAITELMLVPGHCTIIFIHTLVISFYEPSIANGYEQSSERKDNCG